ncbi:MAG: family 16 glycosylhydrolase [Bacteroidota bacterium]
MICYSISSIAQQQMAYKEGFNLVWHDEFSDSAETYARWDTWFPWGPWANGLSYSPRQGNHGFSNGRLEMFNRKEEIIGDVFAYDAQGNFAPYKDTFQYSCGMLYSHRQFLHGYFEAGFQSDPGKGFFNAFWLYGEKNSEIDVFELAGSDPYDAQMTLHWKEKDALTNSTQSIAHLKSEQHFGEIQHSFGVLWTASEINWYHNGKEVPQNFFTRFIRQRHIPDVPMAVIVNSNIAFLDGEPDSTTKMPGKIAFDYCRVYQNDSVVAAPMIVGQQPLVYSTYDSIPFSLNYLAVQNVYNTYPYGFRYEIMPGANYTTNGHSFIAAPGFNETIELQVRVHDGINYSPVKTVSIFPDVSLGITTSSETVAYRLFPNPASGNVHIESDSDVPVRLEMYSADGKLQLSTLLDGRSNVISLSALSKGIYMVIFKSEGSAPVSTRLVVD